MWDDTEWDGKKIQDGIHKAAGEFVLQRYGAVLEEYASQLLGIEDTLSGCTDPFRVPVTIQLEPQEQISVLDLIDTDNKVLNKVLTVFATLCTEVRYLQREAHTKYLEAVLYYGEGGEETILDGSPQVLISHLLPTLQDLICFVKRCGQVLLQLVQQMAAFYSYPWEKPKQLDATDIHLQDTIDHMGDLLLILVILDEVLTCHSTLNSHWNLYQQSVQAALQDPFKYDIDINKIKYLSKMLNEIETELLKGHIFQNVLLLPFEKYVPVRKNAALAEEMILYIKSMLYELETKQNTDPEVLQSWARLCALYVLSVTLFGTSDKKLFKQLWDLSKKFASVTLYGNVVWFPDLFLTRHLNHLCKQLVDKKSQEAVSVARNTYIVQTSQNLPKHVYNFSLQVCSWMVQMEASLKQDLCNFKPEDMKNICNLLLEGIQLSAKIRKLLMTLTNLHGSLGKPMTKSSVLSLCKLVELMKAIECIYNRHNYTIAKTINHVIQRLTYQMLVVITTAKKGLVLDKHYSEKHVDMLSSIVIAEKTLNGPPTKQRLLVTRLALALANRQRMFRDDELVSLAADLACLTRIASLQERLKNATSCDFLYWHRIILQIYFSRLYENKTDINRIKYMLNAVQDSVNSMSLVDSDVSQKLIDFVDQEILHYLNSQFVKPLCQEIETNLRLHTHSHLQTNEVTVQSIKPDCKQLLSLQPVYLFNKYVNLRGQVEQYLERTFYDLTTVALHDWRTYGEMRSLATHKYDLHTVEDNLPSQTLEQGLDVLEIMRNIHIFVSKYLYNLNNQIFVEHSSNNKHLNTINIRHIANSIRTHGTGIMNTTVNFTYQFLRKKLVIFSQFLYDEHIKSRLIRDLCYFRDNKAQLDSKYSYERADKFNKGIRKLGITPDGLTYLDQFRLLITHIGNALGYVRMIRSGGLHCCSNAVCYIPDLDNIIPLEDLCIEEGLSAACINAARSLDQVITNMSKNLTEGTEYFKLLVDVFAPVLRDSKNNHLRNFHMIVPPLTINFVESLIIAKEKMSKKSKVGAAFTDDGFAMGTAYVLKVLDLNAEFDSLHWFQSVRDKYCIEKNAVKKQKQLASKDDDKLQQTLNLTAKRLDMYQQEFELLYYSLSSARIFFQRDHSSVDGDNKNTCPK